MVSIPTKLFESSPAWAIEDDALITYDLAFTTGLRLRGVDGQTLAEGAKQELSTQLAGILEQLPAGTTLRFYSCAIATYAERLQAFKDQFTPNTFARFFAEAKVAHIRREVAPLARELYCFISLPPAQPFHPFMALNFPATAKRLQREAQAHHETRIRDVTRTTNTIIRGLAAAGIQAELLQEQALFKTLWRLANPVQAAEGSPEHFSKQATLRSQLFVSGLREFQDCFVRDGKYQRVVTMSTLPRSVSTASIESILQSFAFPHMSVVTLKRVDNHEALTNTERMRGTAANLATIIGRLHGRDKAHLHDYAASALAAESDDVLARLKAGECLLEVGIQVWLSASTLERLESRTTTVRSQFRQWESAEIAVEEFRGRAAFLSMLPGHHRLIGPGRMHPMVSSCAADVLPVFQAWHGSEKPSAWMVTRDAQLVGFHPFEFHPSLAASNVIVAGSTGVGKSVHVKLDLFGWNASGGRSVIVTMGRDYHNYVRLMGGTVNDVSLDDPTLCLGPFPTIAELRADPSREEQLKHLASIVRVMTCENGQAGRIDKRLINAGVNWLYRDDSDKDAAWSPTFLDWIEAMRVLAREEPQHAEAVAELIEQMRFWTEGPYGNAFCRNRSHRQSSKVSVWNLQQISDEDTCAVVLALISGGIASSINDGRTVVVVDEAWRVLKANTGADLVETLYRVVRKQKSCIWALSQSSSDFASLPDRCRSAILANSPFKFLLYHLSDDIPLTVRHLNLSSNDEALLSSLTSIQGHYSEVLLLYGSQRQILRLIPTPIEYWLTTSDPKDAEVEARVRREHTELQGVALIRTLAKDYPYGALLNGKART